MGQNKIHSRCILLYWHTMCVQYILPRQHTYCFNADQCSLSVRKINTQQINMSTLPAVSHQNLIFHHMKCVKVLFPLGFVFTVGSDQSWIIWENTSESVGMGISLARVVCSSSRCSEWEIKDRKKESCSVSSYIKFIWFKGFACSAHKFM